MTTWAQFCSGSRKDSQAVLSLRLRVPVGPQLVRESGCHVARCSLYAVGLPSSFFSGFPGGTETGLEWLSDSRLSVLEQPRTEARNAGEGLAHLGAVEGCHFSAPWGPRFHADSQQGLGLHLSFMLEVFPW